jgi:uncharacterized membrane protein YkvA (DUF1232 family)
VDDWWLIPVGIAGGIALLWLVAAAVLWIVKPDAASVLDALRLLPDLIRLLKRLASDPELPRGIRIRLGLLLAYLVVPWDSYIPVLGYADDVVIVGLVLRSVARKAGPGPLAKHWPGTPEGFDALRRICRLPDEQAVSNS